MRVSPRRPPRTAESASFPKLFRSILVAAFAAEGCTEVVAAASDAAAPDAAAPDAPAFDAGPPFEDVCPAEEGNYSVQNRLDALRGAAGLDYLEMRTINRASWDGGLNPDAMWMTSTTAGVRCATATAPGACEAAFAALQNDPPSGAAVAWVFAYTRGNEAGVARGVDEIARLYAPIDAAGEAALIASSRHGLRVACVGSARPLPSGGWEVLGGVLSDCTFRSGQRRTITRTLVRVAPDGASTATALETTDSNESCPVPGRRPDGLR
ncbi:MAG: hypothetical protein JWM10_1498, partial [Myxococcaceae bacterium]|nr:hypothetical protein [Myxococcaceae bacterium]